MNTVRTIEKELVENPSVYALLSDQEVLDKLNESITIRQSIKTTEIFKYLVLINKLTPIKESDLDSAKQAYSALTIFDDFDVTNSAVEDKLEQLLNLLFSDNLITATDKVVVKSFGDKDTTRAQVLNLTYPRLGDVAVARARISEAE